MIAISELNAAHDQDLALRLAKSRVALAALKRKHATDNVNDEDVAQATVLRDYFLQSLKAGERKPLDEAVVPRDDVRQILQTVLSTYGSTPYPVAAKDLVNKLIPYLERLIAGRLSPKQAGELIDLLNRLREAKPAPNYEPSELLASNDGK